VRYQRKKNSAKELQRKTLDIHNVSYERTIFVF